MPPRYFPLSSEIWDDEALEGATFEERAFFVWTFSNSRVRPSGIYRVTDAQIVSDTRLPIESVQTYVADLAARRRIVRDGAWIFIRGYLARQPNHDNLLKGAKLDVVGCTSPLILEAFASRYPAYAQWLDDVRPTVGQRSADGPPTVGRPMNGNRPQSSSEQSSTDHIPVVNPRGSSTSVTPSTPEYRPDGLSTSRIERGTESASAVLDRMEFVKRARQERAAGAPEPSNP